MSRFPVLPAVLTLLLAAAALADNPFEGWPEEQVEGHQTAARKAIGRLLRNWFPSRLQVVVPCSYCKGTGEVYALRTSQKRSWKEVAKCEHCRGTGTYVSEDCYRKLFWDCHSPAVRGDEKREAAMKKAYEAAASDPAKELPHLSALTRSRRKGIEVFGNYGIVTYLDEVDDEKREESLLVIEVDGEWWVAHEEADQDFVRYTYPGVEPPEEAVEEERNPDDPTGLFEIDRIRLEEAAEGTYKVTGRIRNVTRDRRFSWIIVTVDLMNGNAVEATARCNAGGDVVGPGESTTFTGYVYADHKPRFSKAEGRVTSFEER
jgi:hypothetical protein